MYPCSGMFERIEPKKVSLLNKIKCKIFGCKLKSKKQEHIFLGVGILSTCQRCGDSIFTTFHKLPTIEITINEVKNAKNGMET